MLAANDGKVIVIIHSLVLKELLYIHTCMPLHCKKWSVSNTPEVYNSHASHYETHQSQCLITVIVVAPRECYDFYTFDVSPLIVVKL